MHRDVKPHNALIDLEKKQLRLIDFGLSEFYIPGKEYNVRVAALMYKAPELLIGHQTYDYKIDLWSAGCVLAYAVFKRGHFFNGRDNTEMMTKIIKTLGTENMYSWVLEKGVVDEEQLEKLKSQLGNHSKKDFSKFIDSKNQEVATKDAIDLISKLLKYDPEERLSAKEAMEHPFFADVN